MIHFWIADYAGCGYYRGLLPGKVLLQNGEDVSVSHVLPEEFPDVLVSQRTSGLGPTTVLRKHPYIFEIDDLLTNVTLNSHRAMEYYSRGDVQHRLVKNMRRADKLVVSTEALKDEFSRYNSNIEVVPNRIDRKLLELDKTRAPQLTVGWAGGDSHVPDLRLVHNALEQVNPPRIHTIGHNPKWGVHTLWQKRIQDYYAAIDFDIGLAPLRESRFNECKSPIKAIEYGALGIPTIASDTGPYARYIKHGETGFLAKRHTDWVKYLTELINDDELREQMGAAAKQQAAQHVAQDYYEQYKSVYSIPARVS